MNTRILTVTFLMVALLLPSISVAASSKIVKCELEVHANNGGGHVIPTPENRDEYGEHLEPKLDYSDVKVKGDAVVLYGEELTIKWDSKNAKKAKNLTTKKSIERDGEESFSPTKKTTYKYEFTNGSKKAQCEVTVHVVKASIKDAPNTTLSQKSTLSGNATGIDSVRVNIYNDTNELIHVSKNIKVKKGTWSTKVTKELEKGTYYVLLETEKQFINGTLATTTLTIGN